uniref:Protein kinase domain-containing protein n=1 Tax=Xenopus tropicalis TaxID=8364 RepID=A0A803KBW5_XENTR
MFKRLKCCFSCFGKRRRKRTDHSSIESVMEEIPQPEMEPATDNCQETPEIPEENICQEEELIVQASTDTSPCIYQESLEESGDSQFNTFEETPEIPENICQAAEETSNNEEEPIVQASTDTSPCIYQETFESCGEPQPETVEENPEQEMEPATDNCQEAPEISDPEICQDQSESLPQEVELEQETKTNSCHCQENLEESDDPQPEICEASPKETGTNTSQEESSEKELSKEDEKDLEEESGTTTCQPEISGRQQVEPQTSEGNNTSPLVEKYPEPGRYFKLGEPIGQDPNGVIYIGWHRSRRMEVAILIMKDQEKQKEIQGELEILRMVSGHKNIVDFYGAYYHQASRTTSIPKGLWIATELSTGATLEDLIGTRKTLGERWISYICKHVIQGLCHLQKKNIIHHDIRPGNILITSFGEVKIGEFGFATFGERSSSTSGSITYSAPEVLANFGNAKLEYDHKADIWSLGIAAIEMAEGHVPFSKLPQEKLIKKITCGAVPSLPSWGKWSDEFHYFISECLQRDPSRRPSARQLLSHPFIGEIWGERGVQRNIAQHLHRGMKH